MAYCRLALLSLDNDSIFSHMEYEIRSTPSIATARIPSRFHVAEAQAWILSLAIALLDLRCTF